MRLLIIKDCLKKIYGSHTAYVEPALKFAVSVITMLVINSNIGFMSVLKNPAIMILIGLLCAFVPSGMILGLMILFMIINIYSLSLELSLIVAVIMIIMYILFFRFTPGEGYVVMLMPILFCVKVPYLMPIILGLMATPVSIISISFGVILYFIIYSIGENAAVISNSGESGIAKVTSVFVDTFNNKEMYLFVVAFSITLIVVYIIRKKSIDYAASVAIIAGGITEVLVILSGMVLFDIETITKMGVIIICMLLSIGIAYVVQFFILAVDYSRTEYVQFEDDDYYYYVKAVPKVTVASQDFQVKRINVRKIKND